VSIVTTAEFEEIRSSGDVTVRAGATAQDFAQLQRFGITLPKSHIDLLARTNGMEVFGGYYRLFGVGETDGIDMVGWNDPKTWKFAWPLHVSQYWCFAEFAWGDQYAYRIEDLKRGVDHVYWLDALQMKPGKPMGNFEAFSERVLVRCASRAIDPFDDLVRRRIGTIAPKEHLAHVPSLMLGADEDPDRVQKLPARVAMVANGDIHAAVVNAPPGSTASAVEPYQDDEHGLTRFHVKWF